MGLLPTFPNLKQLLHQPNHHDFCINYGYLPPSKALNKLQSEPLVQLRRMNEEQSRPQRRDQSRARLPQRRDQTRL
jgi:hypothetical protein